MPGGASLGVSGSFCSLPLMSSRSLHLVEIDLLSIHTVARLGQFATGVFDLQAALYPERLVELIHLDTQLAGPMHDLVGWGGGGTWMQAPK